MALLENGNRDEPTAAPASLPRPSGESTPPRKKLGRPIGSKTKRKIAPGQPATGKAIPEATPEPEPPKERTPYDPSTGDSILFAAVIIASAVGGPKWKLSEDEALVWRPAIARLGEKWSQKVDFKYQEEATVGGLLLAYIGIRTLGPEWRKFFGAPKKGPTHVVRDDS